MFRELPGGIGLIRGPPGTGKSYLIKFVMDTFVGAMYQYPPFPKQSTQSTAPTEVTPSETSDESAPSTALVDIVTQLP